MCYIKLFLGLMMFFHTSQYGLNELKLRFRARLSLHLYKQYMEYVKVICACIVVVST